MRVGLQAIVDPRSPRGVPPEGAPREVGGSSAVVRHDRVALEVPADRSKDDCAGYARGGRSAQVGGYGVRIRADGGVWRSGLMRGVAVRILSKPTPIAQLRGSAQAMVAIVTALTRLLGIMHPFLLTPIGSAGGETLRAGDQRC